MLPIGISNLNMRISLNFTTNPPWPGEARASPGWGISRSPSLGHKNLAEGGKSYEEKHL